MFILTSLIGGILGYLYGIILLRFIFSENGQSESHQEYSSIFYFVSLPTAIVSPIILEFALDATLGSKSLMGGWTGLWQFLEVLPNFIFYIVMIILSISSIFFAMFYVVIPTFLLLGIFQMVCGRFLNNKSTLKVARKVMLTSYQMNVVLVSLALIALYAALKFYLLH